MSPARAAPDEDDEEDDIHARTPLKSPVGGHSGQEAPKWPWVVLGFFMGLLMVLFMPQPLHAAGIGGSSDIGCGAVPTIAPPLVRRRMNRGGAVRNVLVTGGAGLIGSHFALALLDRKGFNVTVVDDLSRGSIETILRLEAIAHRAGEPFNFVRIDVNEEHKMVQLLTRCERVLSHA